MRRFRALRYLLVVGLLVAAGYAFAPYLGDLRSLYQERRALDVPWILLAAALEVAQYVSEGYFIRLLLRILRFEIGLKNTIRVAALDVFATHLLPLGQFGSLAANVYFYRRLGVSGPGIVTLDLALGVIAAGVLLALLVAAVLALPEATFAYPVHRYLALGIGALLLGGLLVWGGSRVGSLRRVATAALRRVPATVSAAASLGQVRGYLSVLRENRREVVLLVVLKDLIYDAIDVTALGCCFLAFGAAPVALLVFAYVASLAAGYASFIPGGLGASDATLAVIFLAAGLDPSAILGATLLYRVVNTLLPVPLGALAYYSLRHEPPPESASSGYASFLGVPSGSPVSRFGRRGRGRPVW